MRVFARTLSLATRRGSASKISNRSPPAARDDLAADRHAAGQKGHEAAESRDFLRLANGDFRSTPRDGGLDEAAQELGVDFREEDTPQEVTTFGGLVAFLAGRVPIRGEIVPAPLEAYEFEILDADPRRVAKLRVRAKTRKDAHEGAV